MPVNDWTRVAAGTFHDFHNSWITHLKEALNAGLLPEGYYAQSEQQAGKIIADVLTLKTGNGSAQFLPKSGSVAVAEAPPKVSLKLVPDTDAFYRLSRKTLVIRHVSGHRNIALVEIASPANKDRPASVHDFVDKALAALHQGYHLLIVDLLPPGKCDPQGLHGAIWETFNLAGYALPPLKPLTLAAYVADKLHEAYVEPLAVGDTLPDMPLFLDPGWYINVPLESTYEAAYRGVPAYWRNVIEGKPHTP